MSFIQPHWFRAFAPQHALNAGLNAQGDGVHSLRLRYGKLVEAWLGLGQRSTRKAAASGTGATIGLVFPVCRLGKLGDRVGGERRRVSHAEAFRRDLMRAFGIETSTPGR